MSNRSSQQECAKRIAKVSAEAKLDVDEDAYLNQFRPHLMDVVYTWANGASFSQICKMTDVFEGELFFLIIRHLSKSVTSHTARWERFHQNGFYVT